jgi:hypothetical protein
MPFASAALRGWVDPPEEAVLGGLAGGGVADPRRDHAPERVGAGAEELGSHGDGGSAVGPREADVGR